MAAWHYTSEGEVFGPYSEDAMTELISKKVVTSGTLIRDADGESSADEWFYARDTALAPHFPDYVPPGEQPPDAKPQTLPEPEPKPVRAGFSRKTLLLIAVFAALFTIGLIAGAGLWVLTR